MSNLMDAKELEMVFSNIDQCVHLCCIYVHWDHYTYCPSLHDNVEMLKSREWFSLCSFHSKQRRPIQMDLLDLCRLFI